MNAHKHQQRNHSRAGSGFFSRRRVLQLGAVTGLSLAAGCTDTSGVSNDTPSGSIRSRGENLTNYSQMSAASTISLIPVIIVFLCLQRYFVEGMAGAVKQ